MSKIIMDQINAIHSIYFAGIISKEDAKKGMIETVKYYFGDMAVYIKYINDILED